MRNERTEKLHAAAAASKRTKTGPSIGPVFGLSNEHCGYCFVIGVIDRMMQLLLMSVSGKKLYPTPSTVFTHALRRNVLLDDGTQSMSAALHV